MDKLISALQAAVPVFLALGIGMLCRSKGFLTREGVDALKKVVLNITLPAVLLGAFATTEYSSATIGLPVAVFLLCCGALGLGFFLMKTTKAKGRLSAFLAAGFEAGMLGYALFSALFPGESLSRFAILDLGQTLFVFTLYKILLAGRLESKQIIKDMVTSPILWAVFAGVLLGATGAYGKLTELGAAGVLDAVTDFVSAPTGMIILLTVGYDLVPKEIPWKKTVGLIAMRLGVMAVFLAALLGLNCWVLDGKIFVGAAVVLCILPPPYVIPVFADEPEQRVEISSALSAMTLISLVLFGIYCFVAG